MPFASILSTEVQTEKAVADCLARADWQGKVDLALAFFSPHHRKSAGAIARTVGERLAPRCFLGCQGETIVGNEREVEGEPALCLWLGRWSGAIALTPFHLKAQETGYGPA